MTHDEAEEVLGIVQRVAPVVLSAAVTTSDTIGTALRRVVGMMVADYNMTDLNVFAYAFGSALDLARHCNATLVTMDRVRKAALAENPVGLNAKLTVDVAVRMVLATESRIITAMTFRSREDVDAIATAMNAAFNQTSEIAADNLDQAVYMALIKLHGAVVAHLADRGRQLPRIVRYKFATALPALRMAHRTYGNPARYQELIDENDVVHPAFMPREGKMLAI